MHIQEMVRAFESLGHQVKILCAREGDDQNAESNLEVEQVNATGNQFQIDRADKERAAIATGVAINERLLALYQYWPFDLIYERYSLWSVAGCRAGCQLSVPVVVEVNAPLVEEQAMYRQFELQDEARAIEAEVFTSADILAVVSQQLKGYLVTRGASAEHIHVIGNAVNTNLFSPAVAPSRIDGLEDNHFVVGFSGSLKMWHGIDTLMLAFQQFHQQHADSRLLIVGDGPKRSWVDGFVSGAGLADTVILTGWMPHQALPGLIARMDVATAPYPASTNHYFSPLKLYEYLAVGRPVIASRIGQTAEILTGGGKALMVEPGDAAALASAMVSLRSDPGLAVSLSESAAREGRCHDWRNNARRIVEIAMPSSVSVT